MSMSMSMSIFHVVLLLLSQTSVITRCVASRITASRHPLRGATHCETLCVAWRQLDGLMGGKKNLTPLQKEALRIEAAKNRRKEALAAAQQYALRGILEKKKKAETTASTSAEGEPEKMPPAPPDFDQVREALKDVRHKDSRKTGQNPRFVSALENEQHEDFRS